MKYTAEDGVPDWAIGKTADEVLRIAQTYQQAVLSGTPSAPAPNVPPAPSMTPSPAPQPAAGPMGPAMPSPDLMYSDAAEYQRQWAAWQNFQTQQQIQQISQPFLQSQAEMAREASRRSEKYTEVWQEYGHEIDVLMQQVPAQNRTSVEAWNTAARMVRGDHIDELAAKRAGQIAANPADTGTVGADGDASRAAGAALDPISRMFADNDPAIARFRAIGKTAKDVISHAAAMGHTPEKYAEMLQRKATLHFHESGAPKSAAEYAHHAALQPS